MKKGQSALEYLVTYGWAILAIVIVAAILWYTGIFNPGKWSASKQCGGFASLTCIDYSTTGSSDARIVLANAAGASITMSSTTTTGSVNCNPAVVAINQQTTCEFSGLSFALGDQVNLNVQYTTAFGLSHSETGFIKIVSETALMPG